MFDITLQIFIRRARLFKNGRFMKKLQIKFVLLNLPSPPAYNIARDWAGTLGVAYPSERENYGHDYNVLLPISLLYEASALINQGYDFKIIDAQALNLDLNQTLKVVKNENPDVIIAQISLLSLKFDFHLINTIKMQMPETIAACIGGVCNVMPEEIIKNNIDFVIQGRYPYYNDILNLTGQLNSDINNNKTGNKILKLSENKNDLDNLHLQTYESLDLSKYKLTETDFFGNKIEWIPILAGVGCPYSCMYCPYPIAFGKKVMHKSIHKLIEEIEYIVKNHKIKGFLMRDVIFTYDENRIFEFCNEIIRRNLNIEWFFETRADLITKELLQKMRQAGCFKINYGVETGSEIILNNIGKPYLNIEKIKEAFQMAKEFEIATCAHLIIGLPGENKKTLEETLKILKKLNPDEINLNFATPYPGTQLYEVAEEKGWIMEHNWSNYSSYNINMRTEDLSVKQLKEASELIKRNFKYWKLKNDKAFRKKWLKGKIERLLN